MRNRRTSLLVFAASLCALLSFSAPCAAQVTRVEDFGRPVAPGSKATYLDLLAQIFPVLEISDDGRPVAQSSIPLTHLSGDYERTTFDEKLVVVGLEQLRLGNSKGRQLLLLAHAFGDGETTPGREGISVLALFRLAPKPQLLDATDVRTDRFTSFWHRQPLLRLGPRSDAVVIANSHHNSSQGYLSLTLVDPVEGKIVTLFDLPTLLDLNACGGTLRQTARLTPLPSPRRARPDILVQIRVAKSRDDGSCGPRTPAFTRHYRARLVWHDANGRYYERGRDLERLSKFNEKNY
ncbi:MAG TPA: hypothetical protein VGV38_17770 [Pyrinomonadaceae bacterium]|nr:hypothetical protein [Pyrinomonadaceae bacterium]